jgi:hypothetical protein
MIWLDELLWECGVAKLEEANGGNHDAVEDEWECDEGQVDVVIARPVPGRKDEHGAGDKESVTAS